MNKIYLSDSIYHNLTSSLKSNFQITNTIVQPLSYQPEIKLIQVENKFYFCQNKNTYFAIKNINDYDNGKDLKFAAFSTDFLLLLLFMKIDKIHAAFKTKAKVHIKLLEEEFILDFSKDNSTYQIYDLSIEFSDNTFYIYKKTSEYISMLFASFYKNELFCRISKKERMKQKDNIVSGFITEVKHH